MSNLHFFTAIFDDFEVLKGSGILSDARLAEIKSYIAPDKFVIPCLITGKTIPNWVVHEPTGLIFLETSLKDSNHYVYSSCLEGLLTNEEVEALNKRASSVWSAAQEKARFDKAAKIQATILRGESGNTLECEYNNAVYDESTDSYFDSLEEYFWDINAPENEERLEPRYLWACKKEPIIKLDLGVIIESYEARLEDEVDLDGEDELQLAIEKFNKANEDKYWYNIDYKTCILLN